MLFFMLIMVGGLNCFSLPAGRKLAIIQGYNEKYEVDAFINRLDEIDRSLDDFQRQLDETQVQTYKKIDNLIEKMSSKQSIDTLSEYAKKKVMEDKLKNQIKQAFSEKLQKVERAMDLKNKLEKLKMENTPVNVEAIKKPIKLENTDDYSNLINVLQQLKKQGKQVTINLDAHEANPVTENLEEQPITVNPQEIQSQNID